jgi:GNAT superfamily N-acetyltransferase
MFKDFESKFWTQSRGVIKAISLDAPHLKVYKVDKSWMVTTNLEDPWMNLGYVEDLEHLELINSLLKKSELSGVVYGGRDLPIQNIGDVKYLRFSTMQRHDFRESTEWFKNVPGSAVIRVGDLAELDASNQIQIETFGMNAADLKQVVGPKVLADRSVAIYNLTHEGQAVSTMTAVTGFIDNQPIVNIWSMATLPERQKQGFGARLMRQVLVGCQRDGFSGAALMADGYARMKT